MHLVRQARRPTLIKLIVFFAARVNTMTTRQAARVRVAQLVNIRIKLALRAAHLALPIPTPTVRAKANALLAAPASTVPREVHNAASALLARPLSRALPVQIVPLASIMTYLVPMLVMAIVRRDITVLLEPLLAPNALPENIRALLPRARVVIVPRASIVEQVLPLVLPVLQANINRRRARVNVRDAPVATIPAKRAAQPHALYAPRECIRPLCQVHAVIAQMASIKVSRDRIFAVIVPLDHGPINCGLSASVALPVSIVPPKMMERVRHAPMVNRVEVMPPHVQIVV